MKKGWILAAAACALWLTACASPSDTAQVSTEPETEDTAAAETYASGKGETLAFATGGAMDTYFALGRAMAMVLNGKMELSNLAVTSTYTSIDNIRLIEEGEQQLALLQSDVMYYAYTGTGLFENERKYENFSALAGLYDEAVQIIAVGDDIHTVADLKGKTVSVGDAGSGVEFDARQILEAYGLSFDDIKVINASFSDSADSLKDGKIDAAFIVEDTPAPMVADLCAAAKISLLQIDDAHIKALQEENPLYIRMVIPSGTYVGIDEDVQTLSVRAVLIASNSVSEAVVYELVSSMFANQPELQESNAKFELLNLDDAVFGICIPFHPGAKKYYIEQGKIME